mgnify:CR=1 FL=1
MTEQRPDRVLSSSKEPVEGLAVTAYAKINLTLEVLGRFPDGYTGSPASSRPSPWPIGSSWR